MRNIFEDLVDKYGFDEAAKILDTMSDKTKQLPAKPSLTNIPGNINTAITPDVIQATDSMSGIVPRGASTPSVRSLTPELVNSIPSDSALVKTRPVIEATKGAGAFSRFLGKYGKALGIGAGVAGAGYGISQMGGGDEPPANNMPVATAPIPEPRMPAESSSVAMNNIDMDVAPDTQIAQSIPSAETNLLRRMISEQQKGLREPMKDIDFSGDTVGTLDNIRAAQEESNRQRGLTNLGRAMAQISEGLVGVGGGKASVSTGTLDTLEKQADLPVEQLKQQMAQEDSDPNSPKSKGLKNLVEKEFGIALKGNPSYNDLQKVVPQLTNLYTQREARQQRMDELQLRLASQQDLAKEKANLKSQELGQKRREKLEDFDIQEQTGIKKENRKLRSELETAEKSLDSQVGQLERIQKEFEKYSKGKIGGTGPVSTLGGTTKYFSADTENLDSLFKKTGLDEMVKMFAGMSKAVDSNAERRAFEATQPNISLDDKTNKRIIQDKIDAAKSLLKKTKEAKQKYDRTGLFMGDVEGTSTPISSPSKVQPVNEVRRQTPDGRTAIFNADTKEFIRYE